MNVRMNRSATGRGHFAAALLGSCCLLFAALACGADAPAPKVIKKGGARFYTEEKRIEMDGKFCLAEGPIDLLACAKGGKEYESVVTVDVNPEILHFCLLLLKLKPGETGPKFRKDFENVPTGSPVIVKVKWMENNVEKVVRGEDLCWNMVDKRTIERTSWVFVGSRKEKDPDTGREVYWANVEKSVISVIPDPFAVLDLPLAMHINYGDYVVNKQLIPKVGTPCTVILEPAPEGKPAPRNPAGGRIVHVDVTGGGRVLIDGLEPRELPESLKKIAKEQPKDSCNVTVDHGAPPATAAAAFEAIDGAGIKIESVETVRVKPNVADAVTVVVAGDKISVKEKELTGDQAKAAVQELAKRGAGITVRAEKGATVKAVIRALRACEGVEEPVLRVIWPGQPAGPG